MSRPVVNIGALATGGGVVHAATAVGQQLAAPAPRRPGREAADVGVLTVLGEELRAVVGVLRTHRGYWHERVPDGPDVHRAEAGGVRVVAMQALEPGPQSAAAAYRRMRDLVGPRVVLLVGVAGGIRPDLAIGDVVIGDEVVCYDARRETAGPARRRGRSHLVTPALRHRVNEFFLRNGPTIRYGPDTVRVFRGPVGSGAAVITDRHSDVVDFLRRFNEHTLAVETEAGGVGQAFYEEAEAGSTGWLTVRGISDLADRDKGYQHHQLAADRAAAVMDRLLPLLARPDVLAEPA